MKFCYDNKYTIDFESEEPLNCQLVDQGYILVKDGRKIDSYRIAVKGMFNDGIIRKQVYSEINSRLALELFKNIVKLEDTD